MAPSNSSLTERNPINILTMALLVAHPLKLAGSSDFGSRTTCTEANIETLEPTAFNNVRGMINTVRNLKDTAEQNAAPDADKRRR